MKTLKITSKDDGLGLKPNESAIPKSKPSASAGGQGGSRYYVKLKINNDEQPHPLHEGAVTASTDIRQTDAHPLPELAPYEHDADMPGWLRDLYIKTLRIPERPDMPAPYQVKLEAYIEGLSEDSRALYRECLADALTLNWERAIFDDVMLWQSSERDAARMLNQRLTNVTL